MTPIQNRVRARVQVPMEMITQTNMGDQIQNHINAQLMDRIADELHRHKSDAIELQEINSPAGPQYQAQIELYVFTKQELEDLLNKTKMQASIDVREQITLVDNWKNNENT